MGFNTEMNEGDDALSINDDTKPLIEQPKQQPPTPTVVNVIQPTVKATPRSTFLMNLMIVFNFCLQLPFGILAFQTTLYGGSWISLVFFIPPVLLLAALCTRCRKLHIASFILSSLYFFFLATIGCLFISVIAYNSVTGGIIGIVIGSISALLWLVTLRYHARYIRYLGTNAYLESQTKRCMFGCKNSAKSSVPVIVVPTVANYGTMKSVNNIAPSAVANNSQQKFNSRGYEYPAQYQGQPYYYHPMPYPNLHPQQQQQVPNGANNNNNQQVPQYYPIPYYYVVPPTNQMRPQGAPAQPPPAASSMAAPPPNPNSIDQN